MTSDVRAIAVVTGGARGIGQAVCRTLAESGVRVVCVDSDGDALRAGVRALVNDGLDVVAEQVDVRDSRAVECAVDRIESEIGAIDTLVNVAGVIRAATVLELTNSDWDAVFAVNAAGVFYFCRAVARHMVGRRRGSIITVSSNAAVVPRIRMAAYAASKAAASSFTRCLGLELAESGIRCNLVSPGSTDTEMLRSLWSHDDAASGAIGGSLDDHRIGIPLGKLATPSDVAEAVAFLASDRAGHITMHDMRVDGGAGLGA